MKECSSETCCSCQNCSCSCHNNQNTCGDKPEMISEYFLQVADEAWEEVLKDEIKKHILATQKDRMSKLAKIVSEGNNKRWKHKMEKKQGCAEFHEELCSFFSQRKK